MSIESSSTLAVSAIVLLLLGSALQNMPPNVEAVLPARTNRR